MGKNRLPYCLLYNSLFSTLLLCIFSTSYALEVCGETDCKIINLPQTDFEVPSFELRDINADGTPELIVTEASQSGAVNVCSLFFNINNMGELEEIKTSNIDKGMYNISFHDGKIISSYRDAASWFEDVYSYKDGRFILEIQDKNGETRALFNENGEVIDSFMINGDDKKWFEREALTGSIKLNKARLYNSPSFEDVSKMYLIKGDSVILRDFYCSESENVCFYLTEFTTANNRKIIKWVLGEALTINRYVNGV